MHLFSGFVGVGLTLSSVVGAAGLNDTGLHYCFNGNPSLSVACTEAVAGDGADYPGQDARFGRDAMAARGVLTKVGEGIHGFDFTKISNGGADLAPSAALGSAMTAWACTRDNVTGLLWEMKTNDGGLRDRDWTYSWYSTNNNTNGGDSGAASGGECGGTVAAGCDTQKYIAAINVASLCGYQDWRLPSPEELRSIAHYGLETDGLDVTFFPNTLAIPGYWSSTSFANPQGAFYFAYPNSGGGYSSMSDKSTSLSARLVRGNRLY